MCLCMQELLRSLDRNLAEFLQVLHDGESSLAGTGASSFVSLDELSFSVLLEVSDLSIEFLNKCFHCVEFLSGLY